MSKLGFDYQSTGKALAYAQAKSRALMDFDHTIDHPDDILQKHSLRDEYDPKLI